MASNSDDRNKLIDALDERYRVDHDLLVRVDTRSIDMASDIKEMKEGLMQEIGTIKAKVDTNSGRINQTDAKIASFETSVRTLRWILAAFAAIVAFTLSVTSGVFNLFNR
jgi:hypothetical protein